MINREAKSNINIRVRINSGEFRNRLRVLLGGKCGKHVFGTLEHIAVFGTCVVYIPSLGYVYTVSENLTEVKKSR